MSDYYSRTEGTIPQEVLNDIRQKKEDGYNNYDIICAYQKGEAGMVIHDFVSSSSGSFNHLLAALLKTTL